MFSPNNTFFPNFSEYDADRSNDVAARNQIIIFDPSADVITRNYPTKPDVPGNPELAIKKITSKKKIQA